MFNSKTSWLFDSFIFKGTKFQIFGSRLDKASVHDVIFDKKLLVTLKTFMFSDKKKDVNLHLAVLKQFQKMFW